MNAQRFAWLCTVSLLVAVPACQGKGTAPTPAKGAAPAGAAAAAKPTPAAAPQAGPAPRAASPAVPPTPVAAAPTPAPSKDPAAGEGTAPKDLGLALADPRWFRMTMFGDKGKTLDTKRSEADEQGRFTSMIRFELTDMDVAGCADHLEKTVKEDISSLERKDTDGRIQLDGKNDRFSVTFVCGEAKGKTIAYVSYAWT